MFPGGSAQLLEVDARRRPAGANAPTSSNATWRTAMADHLVMSLLVMPIVVGGGDCLKMGRDDVRRGDQTVGVVVVFGS